VDAEEILALGTLVLAAATGALVVVTLWQLRLTRKALELDGLSRAIDEVDSVHAQRTAVLAPAFPADPGQASPDEREQARVVTNAMNRLAYLVRKGLLREELVRDLYAESMVMAWDKLQQYVQSDRKKPGVRRRAIYFEEQAERFRRWLSKKSLLR
jgi:hypothetical protein